MTRKNLQHLQMTKSAVAVEQSTEADLQNLFSSFGAGFPPFLRGISTTMYVSEPWKMRQETVFSNLKDWNLFLQNNTQAIEITLETTNNLIQNVDDLFELFAGVDLNNLSIVIYSNPKAFAFLAFCSVFAQHKKISVEDFHFILEINPKESILNQNFGWISNKIGATLLSWSKNRITKKNSIRIVDFQCKANDSSAAKELVYSLFYALDYVKNQINLGAKIDDLAPQIAFVWTAQNNPFEEIIKLRAARVLWAKSIKKFHPQNPQSMAMQQYYQTSKSNFNSKNLLQLLSGISLEASGAVFGGVQAIKTDSSELRTTPYTTRLFRDIQLFLKEETQITKTVDPFGGSFYIEKGTILLVQEVLNGIEKIKNIEDFKATLDADFFTTEFIANPVLEKHTIRTFDRDENIVAAALSELQNSLQSNHENILDKTIEAAKIRATINEIEMCFNK